MSNTVTDNLYRNVSENTKEYFRDVLKLAPYTEPGGLWDSFSVVAERKRQAWAKFAKAVVKDADGMEDKYKRQFGETFEKAWEKLQGVQAKRDSKLVKMHQRIDEFGKEMRTDMQALKGRGAAAAREAARKSRRAAAG